MNIQRFTRELIDDVIAFEHELRKEETGWGWDIDESYIEKVKNSFDDPRFENSVSFLAYKDGKVIGRIDSSVIYSRFDGSCKAYLDWICVLKSCRHAGVAQKLLSALCAELKKRDIDTLIGLIDSDENAQHFYRSLSHAEIRDEGIWIDIP